MDLFIDYLPVILSCVLCVYNTFCLIRNRKGVDWSKFFSSLSSALFSLHSDKESSNVSQEIQPRIAELIQSLDSIIKELKK